MPHENAELPSVCLPHIPAATPIPHFENCPRPPRRAHVGTLRRRAARHASGVSSSLQAPSRRVCMHVYMYCTRRRRVVDRSLHIGARCMYIRIPSISPLYLEAQLDARISLYLSLLLDSSSGFIFRAEAAILLGGYACPASDAL